MFCHLLEGTCGWNKCRSSVRGLPVILCEHCWEASKAAARCTSWLSSQHQDLSASSAHPRVGSTSQQFWSCLRSVGLCHRAFLFPLEEVGAPNVGLQDSPGAMAPCHHSHTQGRVSGRCVARPCHNTFACLRII